MSTDERAAKSNRDNLFLKSLDSWILDKADKDMMAEGAEAETAAAARFLERMQRENTETIFSAIKGVADAEGIEVHLENAYAAWAHGSIQAGGVVREMAQAKAVEKGCGSWTELLRKKEIEYDEIDAYIVGGGKMGSQMAERLNEQGLAATVVETNKTTYENLLRRDMSTHQEGTIRVCACMEEALADPELVKEFTQEVKKMWIEEDRGEGMKWYLTHEYEAAVKRAYDETTRTKPAVVTLMVPADKMPGIAENAAKLLGRNDTMFDGGNTYWKETRRMYEIMAEYPVHFIGGGTSGGINGDGGEDREVGGARHGACFMIDGDDAYAVKHLSPLLSALGWGGLFSVVGGECSGHIVKGYHNAAEYAEMELIAQIVEYWVDVLNWSWDKVLEQARLLQGSKAGSYLVDCLVFGLDNAQLEDPKAIGGQTFTEMNNLVSDALRAGIPLPLVQMAIETRRRSHEEDAVNGTREQIVQLLRHIFGGHNNQIVKKD